MTDHRAQNVGMPPMPVDVNRVGDLARFNNASAGSDIEVIDLDSSRDNVKPTTWHGYFNLAAGRHGGCSAAPEHERN